MAGYVEDFAADLTALKERSGRSYGALAGRLHVSTSTLHRYCNGAAVPAEYAPVERFARLCGATPAELVALHRRWLLADAERRDVGAAAVAEVTGPADVAARALTGIPAPASADTSDPLDATDAVDATATAAPDELDPRRAPRTASASGADGTDSRRRRRRRLLVPGAVVAVAAVAVGVPLAVEHQSAADKPTAAPPAARSTSPAATSPRATAASASATPTVDDRPVPLTASVVADDWGRVCGQWFYATKAPSDVPPPPGLPDVPLWAGPIGAVPGQHLRLQVTVQATPGPANQPEVVLTTMYVRIVGSKPAPKGLGYTTGEGCGGGVTPAYFTVDLDAADGRSHPSPGMEGDKPTPIVDFPLTVSSSETKVLNVDARTPDRDVSWYLDLHWTCGGRDGWLKIDDNGKPFETVGLQDDPLYFYGGHGWVPADGVTSDMF